MCKLGTALLARRVLVFPPHENNIIKIIVMLFLFSNVAA